MHICKSVIIIFAVLFGATSSVLAATHSQQFRNDFTTNRILLWSVEPTTQFTNLTFDSVAVSNWSVEVDTGDALFLLSNDFSTVAPTTGLFTVDFSYTTPTLSFEWAEVFWDGAVNTVLGSGTATFNGSGWTGNNVFSHGADIVAPSVVPVPASGIFLASGLVLGAGFARRSKANI